MRRTIALSLLLATAQLQAQDGSPAAEDKKRDLEWVIGLAGRFQQLHDPVVAAYAISQLGGLVCANDREAGEGLFRESLVRLRTLTPSPSHRRATVCPYPVSRRCGIPLLQKR
jgi:hypothetical protein